MLLSFDIAEEAIEEHDDWHTHEHLPERLSIPGFLRGTRWVALHGASPRYTVLYEVAYLEVLTSAAYLQRLDNPSPWTSRMMPHYRGMKRGLCTVSGSHGLGTGHFAKMLRFTPEPSAKESLRAWLLQEVFPRWVLQRGAGGAHLLEAAATAAMTNEQRIRGADAGVDWAVVLTGYRDPVPSPCEYSELARHGAGEVTEGAYRFDYSLLSAENL